MLQCPRKADGTHARSEWNGNYNQTQSGRQLAAWDRKPPTLFDASPRNQKSQACSNKHFARRKYVRRRSHEARIAGLPPEGI